MRRSRLGGSRRVVPRQAAGAGSSVRSGRSAARDGAYGECRLRSARCLRRCRRLLASEIRTTLLLGKDGHGVHGRFQRGPFVLGELCLCDDVEVTLESCDCPCEIGRILEANTLYLARQRTRNCARFDVHEHRNDELAAPLCCSGLPDHVRTPGNFASRIGVNAVAIVLLARRPHERNNCFGSGVGALFGTAGTSTTTSLSLI